MTFIDELINPFIVAGAPTNQKEFVFGHIFSAPVYYPHQRLELWRPNSVDQKLHTATDFNITGGLNDAFKKSLPYSSPHLATNEEFIALRAKIRPVVLIQPPDPGLAKTPKVSMGINLERHLCVVAPVFGLENAEGYSKVSEEFLNRVRRLEYPQFCFLAKCGPLTKDGLVRLDELQSIAVQHLKPTGFALSPEALSLFRSQVSLFTGGSDGSEFAGYRDLFSAESSPSKPAE
jgi:hypothetical protein